MMAKENLIFRCLTISIIFLRKNDAASLLSPEENEEPETTMDRICADFCSKWVELNGEDRIQCVELEPGKVNPGAVCHVRGAFEKCPPSCDGECLDGYLHCPQEPGFSRFKRQPLAPPPHSPRQTPLAHPHPPPSQGRDTAIAKRVDFQPTHMSPDEVIAYFRTFLSKSSSLDNANEEHYLSEEYAENVYRKIDNLAPAQQYLQWLQKTKQITDNAKQSVINAHCARSSVFTQTMASILRTWEADRTIVINELEQWHRNNEHIPPFELCNRFHGLTCQFRRAENPEVDQGFSGEFTTTETTCQCAGNPQNVGYYKAPPHDTRQQRDVEEGACYVRPWKPCKHLSAVDPLFRDAYKEYHSSMEQERRVLAQIVFPVARTHRCKPGTYCFDLIPGFKKPVCWCNMDNKIDNECKSKNKYHFPLLGSSELMTIRKNFTKLLLPASDTRSTCSPEFNEDIQRLMKTAGEDPRKSGSLEIIKKILESKVNHPKICDFRKSILCDPKSRTCIGSDNCGAGKVHLGQGVCAINNGFRCQSNEDCVVNARCQYFRQVQDSACVCASGYGDKCLEQHKPLLLSRLLPMVSGYQEEEFMQIQTDTGRILETWEDSMSLKLGAKCDPLLDKEAMSIIQYFGNLDKYDKQRGDDLLKIARRLGQEGGLQQCKYTNFLRCDPIHGKCVPIVGDQMTISVDASGENFISVELKADESCEPKIPQVFVDRVAFTCPKGYACQSNGGSKKICVPDCNSPLAPKSCTNYEELENKLQVVDVEWNAIQGKSNPLPKQAVMARMPPGPSLRSSSITCGTIVVDKCDASKTCTHTVIPPAPASETCGYKCGTDMVLWTCRSGPPVSCTMNYENNNCTPDPAAPPCTPTFDCVFTCVVGASTYTCTTSFSAATGLYSVDCVDASGTATTCTPEGTCAPYCAQAPPNIVVTCNNGGYFKDNCDGSTGTCVHPRNRDTCGYNCNGNSIVLWGCSDPGSCAMTYDNKPCTLTKACRNHYECEYSCSDGSGVSRTCKASLNAGEYMVDCGTPCTYAGICNPGCTPPPPTLVVTGCNIQGLEGYCADRTSCSSPYPLINSNPQKACGYECNGDFVFWACSAPGSCAMTYDNRACAFKTCTGTNNYDCEFDCNGGTVTCKTSRDPNGEYGMDCNGACRAGGLCTPSCKPPPITVPGCGIVGVDSNCENTRKCTKPRPAISTFKDTCGYKCLGKDVLWGCSTSGSCSMTYDNKNCDLPENPLKLCNDFECEFDCTHSGTKHTCKTKLDPSNPNQLVVACDGTTCTDEGICDPKCNPPSITVQNCNNPVEGISCSNPPKCSNPELVSTAQKACGYICNGNYIFWACSDPRSCAMTYANKPCPIKTPCNNYFCEFTCDDGTPAQATCTTSSISANEYMVNCGGTTTCTIEGICEPSCSPLPPSVSIPGCTTNLEGENCDPPPKCSDPLSTSTSSPSKICSYKCSANNVFWACSSKRSCAMTYANNKCDLLDPSKPCNNYLCEFNCKDGTGAPVTCKTSFVTATSEYKVDCGPTPCDSKGLCELTCSTPPVAPPAIIVENCDIADIEDNCDANLKCSNPQFTSTPQDTCGYKCNGKSVFWACSDPRSCAMTYDNKKCDLLDPLKPCVNFECEFDCKDGAGASVKCTTSLDAASPEYKVDCGTTSCTLEGICKPSCAPPTTTTGPPGPAPTPKPPFDLNEAKWPSKEAWIVIIVAGAAAVISIVLCHILAYFLWWKKPRRRDVRPS